MRYRLIPSRGRNQRVHVYGDAKKAFVTADEMYRELDMPIVVCEAPVDGIVRRLFTVPPSKNRRTA